MHIPPPRHVATIEGILTDRSNAYAQIVGTMPSRQINRKIAMYFGASLPCLTIKMIIRISLAIYNAGSHAIKIQWLPPMVNRITMKINVNIII